MVTRQQLQSKGLFKQSFTISVVNGGVLVEGEKDIIAQRGNVQAVSILVAGGATDSDYANVEATLGNNGLTFVDKDTLLPYAPSYRFPERSMIPIVLVQNGQVNYRFINKGSTTVIVTIELWFFNPFNRQLRDQDVWLEDE